MAGASRRGVTNLVSGIGRRWRLQFRESIARPSVRPSVGPVLCLPRTGVVSQKRRPYAAASSYRPPTGPRCKVLVADDNRDAAQTLALILKMSGYDVHLAISGSEALAVASRERPDAMFLDIGMPDMSGYEVAGSVRRETWGEHALLVAVTGWGQPNDKERARAAGFNHHLTKPVDLEHVEQMLAAFSKQLEARYGTRADSAS
jgi:CheY-like chemotaxis protein